MLPTERPEKGCRPLAWGGMRWNQDISDDAAVASIHRANELGVNYFDTALQRLGVDTIDFYFLWCIIAEAAFENATKPGMCFDGIRKAFDRGLIRHIGV